MVHDRIVEAKDDEIAELQSQISDASRSSILEVQEISTPQLTHLLERIRMFGLMIGYQPWIESVCG